MPGSKADARRPTTADETCVGSGNVAAVFARWADLAPAPKLVLVRMALQARDSDDPPRYWAGRELLALALGRAVPDAPAPGDRSDLALRARTERQAAFRAVDRTMRVLYRAGAVSLVARPAPGRQAEYYLWINGQTHHAHRGLLAPERTTLSVVQCTTLSVVR